MPRDDTLWYLKNFKIFADIPPEKIDEIAGDTHMKSYSKGDILYTPDDETDQIYVLKQGEVILYHERDGKMVVFDTLGPGSFFGGFSLRPEKINHFAEVAVGSKICNFPQSVMLQLIANFPGAMLQFWQEVSIRLTEYEERLRDNGAPAADILLHELERLKKSRQKSFLGFMQRPLVITHDELAKRTGLNRVTVTREMKYLRDAGRIKVDTKSGAIDVIAAKPL